MKWRGVSDTEPEPLKASLRAELDERRTLMRRFLPAATQAINDRATDELRQAAFAQSALKVGDKAPQFSLPDARGTQVSSHELLANGPVSVTFIRGRWCPFCCATVESWQARLEEVKQRGASVVAISPMSVSQ